jgi:hypothetical protein
MSTTPVSAPGFVPEFVPQHVPLPTIPAQPFRLDVPLHELLQHATREPFPPLPQGPVSLPEPVFPQHPELMHDLDAHDIAAHDIAAHDTVAHDTVVNTGKRHWPADRVLKTMRGWMTPYFKSRILPGEFQPIIAYLFTSGNAISIATTAGPTTIACAA